MADFRRPLVSGPRGARSEKDGDAAVQQPNKRNNIGIACSACKSRKLKCSGEPPCKNCIKNRIECTVDQSGDKRRKSGVKRKLETLEDRKDILLSLIGTLRDSGDRRLLQLLDVIRSNASLAELKFYLDDQRPRAEPDCKKKTSHFLEAYNGATQLSLQQSGSPSSRNILDPQLLADIPQFEVPASPWTTVVDDTGFVSRLISLWFTWFHPFCNWLDRDLFLRDMRSGNLKARFCSPFLVNSILAVASTYSNYSKVYTVPGDIASVGVHFYQEAQRLLDNEEGRITLPTVQGLGMLMVYAGLASKDRHGWIYQNHLAYAVQELSHQNLLSSPKYGSRALPRARVVDHAIWGVFNIATTKALAHCRMPPIKPPNRPFPSLPRHGEDTWYPYPMQLEGMQAHTDCLFHALCGLNRIAYELARISFHGENRSHRAVMERKTDELRTQIRDWASQLPACLEESDGIQVPHVLSLHMYYYTICITLDQCSPSVKPDDDSDGPGPDPDSPGFFFARRISRLARIHRSSWGIDRVPVSNIHSVTTALLTLLANLFDPPNRDAFVNLAVAAKAFSRRWALGRTNLELVQRRAREMGVELPGETGPLFSDLESAASSRKRLKIE